MLLGNVIDRRLCNKIMTLEDFAKVEINVFVVARQTRSITENMYACLLNWLPWKNTPCDMIRLLLKSTTIMLYQKTSYLKKIHPVLSKLEIIQSTMSVHGHRWEKIKENI